MELIEPTLNDTDAAKSLRDAAKLEGHPERIGMTV